MNIRLPAGKVMKFLKKYRFVLLIIAAGVVLLLLPTGDDRKSESSSVSGTEEDFSVEALEEKLGQVLSKVDGAGQVSVVLTVRSGMERVLAQDVTASRADGDAQSTTKTVILSTGSGEETVLLSQNYPTFQGALVVCRGGDDPQVKLLLTQAVAALTGLGSDRITVCKGS